MKPMDKIANGDGQMDWKAGWYALDRENIALRARVAEVEKRDSEAAHHVESVIAMRTGFTGDRPYVGWKGLGLALNEALDARDAAEARVTELTAQLATARRDALEEAAEVCQKISNTDLVAANPPYEEGYSDAADTCFHAIRALIAQEDAAQDRGAEE
jgi:hypothetical protein